MQIAVCHGQMEPWTYHGAKMCDPLRFKGWIHVATYVTFANTYFSHGELNLIHKDGRQNHSGLIGTMRIKIYGPSEWLLWWNPKPAPCPNPSSISCPCTSLLPNMVLLLQTLNSQSRRVLFCGRSTNLNLKHEHGTFHPNHHKLQKTAPKSTRKINWAGLVDEQMSNTVLPTKWRANEQQGAGWASTRLNTYLFRASFFGGKFHAAYHVFCAARDGSLPWRICQGPSRMNLPLGINCRIVR